MIVEPKKVSNKKLKIISEETGINSGMKMNIGILEIEKNEIYKSEFEKQESAILLIEGEIEFRWDNEVKIAKRKNCFDDKPILLHIPKGKIVEILGISKSEILIQSATNETEFKWVYYSQEMCKEGIIDYPQLNGTAKRIIRDIINYEVAPYSKLVIGEVITPPGKWSSFPPHSHPQPEVYYYKFTEKQGFGGCFIGEDVYKITHNSAALIDGGLVHPQVTAPGYGMYYCWMIRHLDGNPWTTRENEKAHEWLLEKNPNIWKEKY